MTTLSFLPSNALVAAFPQCRRQQPSIRLQAMQERKASWKADLTAKQAKQVMLRGQSQGYAFTIVSAADRATLNAGPIVLLAKRRDTGEITGVEAFEAENRTRLNAWIDRAAVVPGIVLCAYRLAGSRVARAAVAADLSPKAARPSAFVTAGKFDLRAIMAAAIASAKVSRAKPLAKAWGACLSDALRDVWQAAKAARPAAAC